jgi:hypothetical protein
MTLFKCCSIIIVTSQFLEISADFNEDRNLNDDNGTDAKNGSTSFQDKAALSSHDFPTKKDTVVEKVCGC